MTRSAPHSSSALRQAVIERAGQRCEYCLYPLEASLLTFEMTDFKPNLQLVSDPDVFRRLQAVNRRLGLLSGALIGLGLAAGAFGLEAVALTDLPMQPGPLSLILGAAALVATGGLAGWLAARLERAWAALLIWLAAAILGIVLIGHLPYEGRTWLVWLMDGRFSGLPIYPFDAMVQARMSFGGFFIVIGLTILGLTQAHRLEGLRGSFNAQRRPSGQTAVMLLFPALIAAGAGLFADNTMNAPLRVAPQLVHEAIRTGRAYTGDLFELSRERSLNYNAVAGVRDRMSANYSLQIGEADLGPAQTVFVVAHFDNGAWINCRVLAGQLSHCYDASPPYVQGFAAWLTGQPAGDCRACALKVREGLTLPAATIGNAPRITRLAQWGSYVLMRAEAPSGGEAVECLFHGISPVTLERCAAESS